VLAASGSALLTLHGHAARQSEAGLLDVTVGRGTIRPSFDRGHASFGKTTEAKRWWAA